ncbi:MULTISPECIES: hypothetical protein [unclassified Streptomyces]|uniref:hypothetical protein n=1 Tax=unclassified Streptomyces TaxID=2593676 RepID=UPI00381B7C0F
MPEIRGGFHEVPAGSVPELLAEAHGDHVIALDVLRDLPTSPADARCTAGRRTELSVYVAPAHRDGGPSRSAPPRTADAR